MTQRDYLLPGGYVDESGQVHRKVEMTAMSGREEELLAQSIHKKESASLVTTILSRCVKKIGMISPVSEELAANLLVADRQYLMLKLRELTFGEQIQGSIVCPWSDCRNKMDIDFLTGDIPIRESENKGPLYRMELSEEAAFINDSETYQELVFRLPTGQDQEMVSPALFENEALAFTLLLKRCLQKVGPFENPEEELINRLSPRARMEIEKEMEAVAPKVDLSMEANCPECQRDFSMPFDLQKFFFGELQTSFDQLYKEVHYLALHYHWSEKEIMEMSREKRYRYINVLTEEIERMNNEV